MKWEIVTLCRRHGYPDRNRVQYEIVKRKPKKQMGDIYWIGDYEIEVIYVKSIPIKKMKYMNLKPEDVKGNYLVTVEAGEQNKVCRGGWCCLHGTRCNEFYPTGCHVHFGDDKLHRLFQELNI